MTRINSPMTLDEIIGRAGGVNALAKLVGVDHSTVSSGWRRSGAVPIKHARRVAEALGLLLSDIRPEIWRREE